MPKFKVTIIWCFQFVLFVNSRQFEYLRVIKAGFIKGFLALDDEKNVDKYENILKRAFNVLNLNKSSGAAVFQDLLFCMNILWKKLEHLKRQLNLPKINHRI